VKVERVLAVSVEIVRVGVVYEEVERGDDEGSVTLKDESDELVDRV